MHLIGVLQKGKVERRMFLDDSNSINVCCSLWYALTLWRNFLHVRGQAFTICIEENRMYIDFSVYRDPVYEWWKLYGIVAIGIHHWSKDNSLIKSKCIHIKILYGFIFTDWLRKKIRINEMFNKHNPCISHILRARLCVRTCLLSIFCYYSGKIYGN